MKSINSKYFQVYNAKQFKESVSEDGGHNLFFTFGKCTPWDQNDLPDDPSTSVASFYDIWSNAIGGKKITGANIRHAIPRFNWTSGQVYCAYDDTIDSLDLKNANTKFFVVTDDWNVYKCIANNSGTASTAKPVSTSYLNEYPTDGYVWKFMYKISEDEIQRFVTDDFIPVKTLTVSDSSLQWSVQSNTIPGAIHSIAVVSNGSNYLANASVTITGDGYGANAYAVRDATHNTISKIIVTDQGAGYSFANATITSATGANATARVILSPAGGHGSDPVTELGGSYLILNIKLESDEAGTLTVKNDYRQVAIIEDPYVYGTSNIASGTVINQTTGLQLNGVSVDYIEDEWVYQGASLDKATFKARLVEWDSANNIAKVANIRGRANTDLLIGQTSTAARFLDSVENPDLEPFTGRVLYLNNTEPVPRDKDQTEIYQIILSF